MKLRCVFVLIVAVDSSMVYGVVISFIVIIIIVVEGVVRAKKK